MARITLFKWVWFSTSTSTAPNTAPSRVASSAERMLVPDSLMAVQMSAYRPRRSSPPTASRTTNVSRSEEHTSELQSHSDLVCRLLLEKKKREPTLLEHHSEQERR